jgi:hypothetical protein
MRSTIAFLVAMLCASCATMNYLHQEYGSAPPDATIILPSGSGFWVFAHKTKPKLIVAVDPQHAAGIGISSGLTGGAASGAPPYAEFDAAAKQWLDGNRPGCRAVNGHPIERVYYEYEFECGKPTQRQKGQQH